MTKVYLVIWRGWTDMRVMKAFSTLDAALAYAKKKNDTLDRFDAQQYNVLIMDVED